MFSIQMLAKMYKTTNNVPKNMPEVDAADTAVTE
jgi:hypothetical protein